jgi:4-hydroxy-3-methylbut-2-en-1-yl diphosphate synthase IspG/GcpE
MPVFESVIVADDCRKEDNGKDIAIGIYTGSVISTVLPFALPQMAVRFVVRPEKLRYDNVHFSLKNPDGKNLVEVRGSIAVSRLDIPGVFVFKFGPVVFEKAGRYTLHLGMDADETEVSSFLVEKGLAQPKVI